MSKVTIEGLHLVRDGKPFFWLADTIWTAFTSPADDKWIEYLDLRAAEGFNMLQINALPQWDRSDVANPRYPYATTDNGVTFDVTREVPEFWEHAKWQLSEAVKRGFTPAIVVQWSNYVPNTWASNIASQNIIPDELVDPVVQKICSSFNEFDPIYIVSGDTDFDHEEPVARYMLVTDCVKKYGPMPSSAITSRAATMDCLSAWQSVPTSISTSRATTSRHRLAPTRLPGALQHVPTSVPSSTPSPAMSRWATRTCSMAASAKRTADALSGSRFWAVPPQASPMAHMVSGTGRVQDRAQASSKAKASSRPCRMR
jgi:hypothetical protein